VLTYRHQFILVAAALALVALVLLLSLASAASMAGSAGLASLAGPTRVTSPAGKTHPALKASKINMARLASRGSASGITANEAALNPDGLAFEVNRDNQGDLWISDNGSGPGTAEIWHVRPATGAYTIYGGLSYVSDAHMDTAGSVWWANAGFEPQVGRIDLKAGTVTTWTLPNAGQVVGVGIAGESVWISDPGAGQVYSFELATTELCTYTVPEGGGSDYVLAGAGGVWLGDWRNGRMVKLDPAAGEFTYWQLSADAHPEGLALTENGDLWWADAGTAALGYLEPPAGRVTTYSLPYDAAPGMLALNGGRVWYSDNFSGTLGALNPLQTAGTTTIVLPVKATITADCADIGKGVTSPVSTRTGTLAWSARTYTNTSGGGWTVYQLPAGAAPWGVTTGTGQLWAVDNGRQVLIRLPLPSATLIVTKVVVNDNGGTRSAADFSFSVNGGPAVPFDADGQNQLTVVPGTYTVTESAASGYVTTYDNCARVAIPAGSTAICTITNNDYHKVYLPALRKP
jgi:streptogramin lyase